MGIAAVGDPVVHKHPYNPELVEIWVLLDRPPPQEWLDRLELRKKLRRHTWFKSWRLDVGDCLVLDVEKQPTVPKYGRLFGLVRKWIRAANRRT